MLNFPIDRKFKKEKCNYIKGVKQDLPECLTTLNHNLLTGSEFRGNSKGTTA